MSYAQSVVADRGGLQLKTVVGGVVSAARAADSIVNQPGKVSQAIAKAERVVDLLRRRNLLAQAGKDIAAMTPGKAVTTELLKTRNEMLATEAELRRLATPGVFKSLDYWVNAAKQRGLTGERALAWIFERVATQGKTFTGLQRAVAGARTAVAANPVVVRVSAIANSPAGKVLGAIAVAAVAVSDGLDAAKQGTTRVGKATRFATQAALSTGIVLAAPIGLLRAAEVSITGKAQFTAVYDVLAQGAGVAVEAMQDGDAGRASLFRLAKNMEKGEHGAFVASLSGAGDWLGDRAWDVAVWAKWN